MDKINLGILLGSATILAIGLVSRRINEIPLSRPLMALAAGVMCSLFVNIIPLPGPTQADLVEIAARLSLAIGLMGTALQIHKGQLTEHRRSLATLVLVGMLGMWLISSVLVYLIMGVSWLTALLVGAIVTPTDPILARTVSEGDLAEQNIPRRMRSLLLGESGINDGLAYPFVFLPIAIMAHRNLLTYWGLEMILYAVVGGSLLGLGIGYLAGTLLRWSQERMIIARTYYLAFTVLLALFTVALGELLHMNGLLMVFFAGTGFKRTRSHEEQGNAHLVQTTTDLFLTLPVFFILGFILPWQAWLELGWSGIALVAAVLLLRRLPAVLALKRFLRPEIVTWREALFAGWFGPIGISALYYAALALRHTGEAAIWPVASLIIVSSVGAHGMTATGFTRWLGRSEQAEVDASGREAADEEDPEGSEEALGSPESSRGGTRAEKPGMR